MQKYKFMQKDTEFLLGIYQKIKDSGNPKDLAMYELVFGDHYSLIWVALDKPSGSILSPYGGSLFLSQAALMFMPELPGPYYYVDSGLVEVISDTPIDENTDEVVLTLTDKAKEELKQQVFFEHRAKCYAAKGYHASDYSLDIERPSDYISSHIEF